MGSQSLVQSWVQIETFLGPEPGAAGSPQIFATTHSMARLGMPHHQTSSLAPFESGFGPAASPWFSLGCGSKLFWVQSHVQLDLPRSLQPCTQWLGWACPTIKQVQWHHLSLALVRWSILGSVSGADPNFSGHRAGPSWITPDLCNHALNGWAGHVSPSNKFNGTI